MRVLREVGGGPRKVGEPGARRQSGTLLRTAIGKGLRVVRPDLPRARPWAGVPQCIHWILCSTHEGDSAVLL